VDRQLIAAVTVFDIYQGKGVPEGQVSVAVRIRLEPTAGTLNEDTLLDLSRKIVETAKDKAKAMLRS
jgi:phenylalanyl-tRNA synthetase beta chain